MPFSEDYFRASAISTALEWFLFREVSRANNPREVLDDFKSHMDGQAATLRATATERAGSISTDTFSNMVDAASATEELGKELAATINIS